MRIGIIISLLFFTSLQSFGIIIDTDSLNDSLGDDGGIVCVFDLDEDDESLFSTDLNDFGEFNLLFYQVIFTETTALLYSNWIDSDCSVRFSNFISTDTSPPYI